MLSKVTVAWLNTSCGLNVDDSDSILLTYEAWSVIKGYGYIWM